MSFLDRIRYHRPPKSPEEADRLALRQLEMRGADLSKPRHLIHFLLFADEGDARTAEEEIGEGRGRRGSSLRRRRSLNGRCGSTESGSWSQTIAAFRAQFEQLAERHGGEYDGWEASAKP